MTLQPQEVRGMLSDTLYAASVLWAVLFIADLVKPGFASNYISLPGFAAVVFILAILALATKPAPETLAAPAAASREPWYVYAVFGAAMLAAFLAAGLPLWLTLAVSSVTLMAFYAASSPATL